MAIDVHGEEGRCEVMRIVTFKIEDDLLKLIDEYAKKNRMTRTDVIRTALTKFVREELAKEIMSHTNASSPKL